jgi:hypothetical protein
MINYYFGDVLEYMGFIPDQDFRFGIDDNGDYFIVWLSSEPRPTDAEIEAQALPWRIADLTDLLEIEYMRRVTFVNVHIGSGVDGLEILEATLKAARDMAEKPTADLIAWIEANTALSPPASLANIDSTEFTAILRVQPEFAAILDLRAARNAILIEIDALTEFADAESYDIATNPIWPA